MPNTEPGVHSPSDGGGVEVTYRVDPGALCNITAEKVPHSFRGCNGQTHNGKKNRNFLGENVQLSFADNTPWASLVVQMVKNLPAMWETWVRSLGQEDPLQEEMATYSSILPWGISQTEEPVGYSPWDQGESDRTEATEHTCTHLQKEGELGLPRLYGFAR